MPGVLGKLGTGEWSGGLSAEVDQLAAAGPVA